MPTAELPVQVTPYDMNLIKQIFPQAPKNSVSCPVGNINILLGSDNVHLMPREIDRRERMVLYESLFAGDTELVVAGQSNPSPRFVLQT